jgi:hypothetical protein
VAAVARARWRHRWRVLTFAVAVSTLIALMEIVAQDLTDRADLRLMLFTELTAAAVSGGPARTAELAAGQRCGGRRRGFWSP